MIRFFLISLLFILVSCGEEPNENTTTQKAPASREKLQGSWVISRGIGPYADRQVGQVYSFKDDKFQFNKGAMYFMGTVKYEENSFILTPDKNKLAKRFFFEFKSDTMIMTMEGSELTFYLTKIITN